MRLRLFLFIFSSFFLLSFYPSASWAKSHKRNIKKISKKSLLKQKTIGDVTLRISSGVHLFSLSDVTGEFTQKYVGDRDAVDILLVFEYAYFWKDNTALVFSLPFILEIYPSVNPLLTINAGIGVRQYLMRYFFAEGQIYFSPFSRSVFRLEFAGFMLGIGASIPFLSRYRFFITAQFPFNFIQGFQIGINSLIGLEVLF